jgi:hypothetical protein
MARTTGRSGFKMRSGNTSTFKMMGSSPMRGGDKQSASEYYQTGTNTVQEMVNAGATSKELRDFVLAHNAGTRGKKFKGGSAGAKINFSSVKGYKPQEATYERPEQTYNIVTEETPEKPPREDKRENFGFLPKK